VETAQEARGARWCAHGRGPRADAHLGEWIRGCCATGRPSPPSRVRDADLARLDAMVRSAWIGDGVSLLQPRPRRALSAPPARPPPGTPSASVDRRARGCRRWRARCRRRGRGRPRRRRSRAGRRRRTRSPVGDLLARQAVLALRNHTNGRAEHTPAATSGSPIARAQAAVSPAWARVACGPTRPGLHQLRRAARHAVQQRWTR